MLSKGLEHISIFDALTWAIEDSHHDSAFNKVHGDKFPAYSQDKRNDEVNGDG